MYIVKEDWNDKLGMGGCYSDGGFHSFCCDYFNLWLFRAQVWKEGEEWAGVIKLFILCGDYSINVDTYEEILYIKDMKGLNQKQREFLVDISSKLIVYISTVVIVEQLIGHQFETRTVWIFVAIVLSLIVFSLYLLKGDNSWVDLNLLS